MTRGRGYGIKSKTKLESWDWPSWDSKCLKNYLRSFIYGYAKDVLLKGRLSTVDLHAVTSLNQFLFILIIFIFYAKQAILIWRSNVLSLLTQLEFLGSTTKVMQQCIFV